MRKFVCAIVVAGLALVQGESSRAHWGHHRHVYVTGYQPSAMAAPFGSVIYSSGLVTSSYGGPTAFFGPTPVYNVGGSSFGFFDNFQYQNLLRNAICGGSGGQVPTGSDQKARVDKLYDDLVPIRRAIDDLESRVRQLEKNPPAPPADRAAAGFGANLAVAPNTEFVTKQELKAELESHFVRIEALLNERLPPAQRKGSTTSATNKGESGTANK